MINDEYKVKETYLPFAVEALRLYQPASGEQWWCHVQQISHLRWNIQLVDSLGQVVIEIVGFEVRVASQAAWQAPPFYTDWLCTIEWQAQALRSKNGIIKPQPAVKGNWLVFGEAEGIGDALVSQLRSLGAQATLVVMQMAGIEGVEGVNPEKPEEFLRLVQELLLSNDDVREGDALSESAGGVVYLWGAESALSGVMSVPELSKRLCGGALHLVQALGQSWRLVIR